MAINLEAMRAKLEASRNGGKKQDNTKWRPSEGDQTIRLMPASDGDPFKEFHFHYNDYSYQNLNPLHLFQNHQVQVLHYHEILHHLHQHKTSSLL